MTAYLSKVSALLQTFSPQRRLIILGSICVLMALAGTLFYESSIGLDSYCSVGFLAGAGWITAGLFARRRYTLLALYAVFTVTAIVGILPLLLLLVFTINPIAGDHFVATNYRTDDERLGSIVRPNAWGHDANGFRNPRVPEQVDLIAIGDSQTWGVSAARDETWPYVLGKLADQSVYNMSGGGYGPAEYRVLVEDALAHFSPHVMVIGLYFGNDLYDAYASVYTRDAFANLRNPAADPDLLKDTVGPMAVDIGFDHVDAVYSGGRVSTKFAAEYRSLAVDLDEPRIAEGMRITQETLVDIHKQAQAQGVRLLVVLIPTKELVYADLMTEQVAPAYNRLVRLEQQAREQIIATLDANGIEYADSLGALRGAIRAHHAVYPPDVDGHPRPGGYEVIAEAVYQQLKNGMN